MSRGPLSGLLSARTVTGELETLETLSGSVKLYDFDKGVDLFSPLCKGEEGSVPRNFSFDSINGSHSQCQEISFRLIYTS